MVASRLIAGPRFRADPPETPDSHPPVPAHKTVGLPLQPQDASQRRRHELLHDLDGLRSRERETGICVEAGVLLDSHRSRPNRRRSDREDADPV